MHLDRTQVNVTVRREVVVKVIAGQFSIQKLYTPELYDAMTLSDFESSGFSIENYLSQWSSCQEFESWLMASFARVSTRSFSG